ncbi:MAG TPA: flagellar hook-length control protein FliK [Bacillota bacterium]|nr:flagellar hook-length control protein FliK [Bacillota bacterium]
MDTMLNLFEIPAAGETAFIIPGQNNCCTVLPGGESLFKALLFQKLTEQFPNDTAEKGPMTDEEGIKEVFWDLDAMQIHSKKAFLKEVLVDPEATVQEIEEGAGLQENDFGGVLAAAVPVNAAAPVDEAAPAMEQDAIPVKAALSESRQGPLKVVAQELPETGPAIADEGKAETVKAEKHHGEQIEQGRGIDGVKAATGPETGAKLDAAVKAWTVEKFEEPEKTDNRPAIKPAIKAENNKTKPEELPAQPAMTVTDAKAPGDFAKAGEKVEAYDQVGREILHTLRQKGPMQFAMQLEPKHLGKIDIKLKLNEGKLTIDIMAFNSKTQAILAGQVDKLVMSMGLRNVVVENVHVTEQTDFQNEVKQGQAFSQRGEMDFSRGRQQEHLSQQWSSRNGSLGSKVTAYQSIETSLEGSIVQNAMPKNGFSRMDYII